MRIHVRVIRAAALALTSALLALDVGANVLGSYKDAQTGLTWSKVTTLEEGMALGLRAATSSEFEGLFAQKTNDWQYDSASNSYNASNFLLYGSSLLRFLELGNYQVSWSDNYTCSGGGVGSHCSSGNYQNWDIASLGWLDGQAGGAIGAYVESGGTINGIPHFNGSASATTLDKLLAETTLTQAPTSEQVALNAYAQAGSGYQLPFFYMVQAVPELTSMASMGLGLAGVTLTVLAGRRGSVRRR